MKGRWIRAVFVAALLGLVALAFVYPSRMVSPGALSPGHASLATDCFACHAPWHGAAADRCTACHALPDIGVRTTKGLRVASGQAFGSGPPKVLFHQQLADPDCLGCHTDHASPRLTQRSRKPFSHALLQPAIRDRCESCHTVPALEMHRTLTGPCAQCHQADAWKPATFAHDKHFLLDRDHDVSCVTCHVAGDYRRYTCYGCHEHTPAKVLRKHQKEGIRDTGNCVRCHRSADDEPRGKEGGEGERNQRDQPGRASR